MERAGLEPATPSLQIRSHVVLRWSGMVERQRASHPRLCRAAVSVSACRRDL